MKMDKKHNHSSLLHWWAFVLVDSMVLLLKFFNRRGSREKGLRKVEGGGPMSGIDCNKAGGKGVLLGMGRGWELGFCGCVEQMYSLKDPLRASTQTSRCGTMGST